MATKRWRLVVTDLGGSETLSEVAIEGENWMSALKAGRGELGEEGGVPTGASCAVAPDGKVTILDPVERRRYVLTPDTSTSFQRAKPSGPRIPAEDARADQAGEPAAQQEAAAQEPAEQPAPAKKASKKTVAYMPSPVGPEAAARGGGEVVVGGGEAAPQAAGPSAPAAQAPANGADGAAAGDDGPKVQPAPAWEQLSGRDREPSDDNPLRYRERTYVVPEDTSRDAAEAVLRARFEELREELADEPSGKFFNLAIFDHRWEGKPKRPPIVTVAWKDWRGEPEVAYPLDEAKAKAEAQEAPAQQAQATGSAPRSRVSSRPPPTGTDEHDARLANAFEACQDLLFLGTPVEGLDFVVKLLAELVPSEAIAGCLYDINTDEFRFVTVTGPGAEERKGHAIPSSIGLFGAASQVVGSTLRVDEVSQDARFDGDADGRPQLRTRSAAYVPLHHQGQLLGMLQLVNRTKHAAYSTADADLLVYVGGQLAEFLFSSRMKTEQALAKG